MMTDLLDPAKKVTLEQAIDIAFSPQVYHAEVWQTRLKQAWTKSGASSTSAEATEVYDLIQKWNRRTDADSEGALAYYAFKKSMAPEFARQVEVPADVTDEQLIAAVQKASEWLKSNFGSVHLAYGKYFRVGRQGGDRTFPVGGGSLNSGPNNVAMATPRAITFNAVGKEMVGQGGQTSTQIVFLTNPPKSYAIIPLGESDHKESGHWDDQAEKLFSKSKAAPTYFLDRNELMKHVTVKKVLKRTAAAQAAR
jgi:acyl-homoserine lactone acylase PvdQ